MPRTIDVREINLCRGDFAHIDQPSWVSPRTGCGVLMGATLVIVTVLEPSAEEFVEGRTLDFGEQWETYLDVAKGTARD